MKLKPSLIAGILMVCLSEKPLYDQNHAANRHYCSRQVPEILRIPP